MSALPPKADIQSLPQTQQKAVKRDELFEKMPEGVKGTVFDDVLKELADNGPVSRERLTTQGRPYVYWMPLADSTPGAS